MKSYIGFMMALSGVVAADSVNVSHNSRSVVIKFDEPVVPLSVVENSYNDKATPQDLLTVWLFLLSIVCFLITD